MGTFAQDEGPILRPPRPKPKPKPEIVLAITCDLSCNWQMDEQNQGHLDPGDPAWVKVVMGQKYRVLATTDDGKDTTSKAGIVSSERIPVDLQLIPVRDARLKAENAQTATLLVMCDLRCNWKLDGEVQSSIEAGGSAKEKVQLGQHIVAASTLDDADHIKREVDVRSAEQALVNIELQPIRDARLESERQARDSAERERQQREQAERQQPPQQKAARNSGVTQQGVWREPLTRLIWTDTDNKADISWPDAQALCRNLRLAGYSDWRLPTPNELRRVFQERSRPHCRIMSGCGDPDELELSSLWVWTNATEEATGKADVFFFGGIGTASAHPKSERLGDRAVCVR